MTDKNIAASKLLALINEYDDSVHDLPQAIRGLIDEAPEVESVAGYKLVPIEATQEMIDAGDATWLSLYAESKDTWEAMLSAAPQQPDIVAELVEALGDANNKIRKAKDFEYESQEHISESATYEVFNDNDLIELYNIRAEIEAKND